MRRRPGTDKTSAGTAQSKMAPNPARSIPKRTSSGAISLECTVNGPSSGREPPAPGPAGPPAVEPPDPPPPPPIAPGPVGVDDADPGATDRPGASLGATAPLGGADPI